MSLHLKQKNIQKHSRATHFLMKGMFSSIQIYTRRLQENFCSDVFLTPISPRHIGKQIVEVQCVKIQKMMHLSVFILKLETVKNIKKKCESNNYKTFFFLIA